VTVDAFCALKGLVTSLRLVREGPPEALRYSVSSVNLIDRIGSAWAERVLVVDDDPQGEGKPDLADELHEQLLIARLSALIVQKLHFHAQMPQFTARYEVEAEAAGGAELDLWERDFQVASNLLTLLGTIEVGGGGVRTLAAEATDRDCGWHAGRGETGAGLWHQPGKVPAARGPGVRRGAHRGSGGRV
jgi:hypothetical protein